MGKPNRQALASLAAGAHITNRAIQPHGMTQLTVQGDPLNRSRREILSPPNALKTGRCLPFDLPSLQSLAAKPDFRAHLEKRSPGRKRAVEVKKSSIAIDALGRPACSMCARSRRAV
jgi:hypothetical protein